MDAHAWRSMRKWRRRGLLGRLFYPKVNERFCSQCKRPKPPHPQPKPIAEFQRGDLGAFIYPAGSYVSRSLQVRFGRWKSNGRHFYLSDYVSADELEQYLELVQEVLASLAKFGSKRQRGWEPQQSLTLVKRRP